MTHRPLVEAAVCTMLLLLGCSGARTALAGISGQLLLRIDCYHHPSRFTRWERPCDHFSGCDPRFRLCLTDRPRRTCRLQQLTLEFKDRERLGACAAQNNGKKNFPPLLRLSLAAEARRRLLLTVTIHDVDEYQSPQLIDELLLRVVPGVTTVPNNGPIAGVAMSRLNVSSRVFTGTGRPRLDISGLLRCAEGHYGPLCATECLPSRRYRCGGDGRRQCAVGWRGPRCEQLDHCSNRPCKAWAECRHVGDFYRCFCGGRAGRQCERGLDACIDHRCANGAGCLRVDDRPVCNCSAGWTGPLCSRWARRLPTTTTSARALSHRGRGKDNASAAAGAAVVAVALTAAAAVLAALLLRRRLGALMKKRAAGQELSAGYRAVREEEGGREVAGEGVLAFDSDVYAWAEATTVDNEIYGASEPSGP